MISDWRTYSPEDFVPFTERTYFRILERHNELFWPWSLLFIGFGLLLMVLAWRGKSRWCGPLLGLAWVLVGVTFLMGPYANLNWAGRWFGWGFVLQGALLGVAGLSGGLSGRGNSDWVRWAGAVLAVGAMFGFLLLGPLSGRGMGGSEWFGLSPDPTMVVTLGILLMCARGWVLGGLLVVPFCWSLITGLTLHVIGAGWVWLYPVAMIWVVAWLFVGRATTNSRNRK